MVDKMDIKSLHLARMRSFISVVSQEPILFNCSIRDNIAYGLENEAGMDDVIEAARSANIHEFITGLPMVHTFSNTTCPPPPPPPPPTHVKVSMYTCHKPQSLQELLFFVLTSTSDNVSNKFSCKNIEIKKTQHIHLNGNVFNIVRMLFNSDYVMV